TFDLRLSLGVKIDRQMQDSILTIELPLFSFCKIVFAFHRFRLFSYSLLSLLVALRAEIIRMRALDSVSSRNVWQTTNNTPVRSKPSVIQRASFSLCSSSDSDKACGSIKIVAARSNSTRCC